MISMWPFSYLSRDPSVVWKVILCLRYEFLICSLCGHLSDTRTKRTMSASPMSRPRIELAELRRNTHVPPVQRARAPANKDRHMQHRSQHQSDEASELESTTEFVRALAKGLAVIEAFDSSAP